MDGFVLEFFCCSCVHWNDAEGKFNAPALPGYLIFGMGTEDFLEEMKNEALVRERKF